MPQRIKETELINTKINNEKEVKNKNIMINNMSLLKSKKIEFLKNMVAFPSIELSSEECDAFIDLCCDESFFLNGNCRLVKMNSPKKNIRLLDFDDSKRFLHPESSFSSSDYTKTFKTGKLELNSHTFRGAIFLSDSDVEDAPDEDFAQTIMGLIAKRCASEIDEYLWVGNTSSTGFGVNDMRKQANNWRHTLFNASPSSSGDLPTAAEKLDASSTSSFSFAGNISEQNTAAPYQVEHKWKKMLSTLPNRFKGKGFKDLRFYCNPVVCTDYSEKLQERSTPLGDSAVLGKNPMQYGGVNIAQVPLFPTTFSSGSAGTESYTDTASTGNKFTDVVLTNLNNWIVGFQRKVTIESERSAVDSGTYIFYSVRLDCKVQDPAGAVILYNVTNG